MSVSRQFNWLGQMRVDVPHLRTIDSSNANDFDTLAGIALAGQQSLVVNGFLLITSNAVGQPATNLQLQVDPGVIWHYNASENGSIFRTPVGTAPQQLTSTNPVVLGSFTAGQLNYVGLDLQRSSDPSTSDLVEFLDADTLVEDPETVPLARTLNYVIVISTSDFTSQPNVLPLALVTTDASNNVLSLQDARQMAFRLGSGGTTPSPYNTYAFSQGRNELQNSDGFSGGDKAFTSLHDAIQGIETRVRELGGGSFWYSTAADRQVKFTRNLATRFANGDNFELYPSTSAPTDLLWQGLNFVFCNSGNATIYQNAIADQATPLAGLTNLAPGECIYVDINELEQIPTGLTALQPQKANMATLGVALAPFTRWVIAWCVSSTPVNNYFTLDSQFGVGTILAPASTTANGVVELNTSSQAPTQPVVVVADASGNAIATGLSRGNGSLPQFTTGTLAIGYGTLDTTITVGNSTNISQTLLLGYGPNIGGHTTNLDGNTIQIGALSTHPTILVGNGTSDIITLRAATLNLTDTASNNTANVNLGSGTAIAYSTNFNIFSNLTGAASTGIVQIGNNNSNLWTGYFLVGDANYASQSVPPQSAYFVGLSGGFTVVTSPFLVQSSSFTASLLTSCTISVELQSTGTSAMSMTNTGVGTNPAVTEQQTFASSGGGVHEIVVAVDASYTAATPVAHQSILNIISLASQSSGSPMADLNITAQSGNGGHTTAGPANLTIQAASLVSGGHTSGTATLNLLAVGVGASTPTININTTGGSFGAINIGSSSASYLNLQGVEIDLGTIATTDNINIGSLSANNVTVRGGVISLAASGGSLGIQLQVSGSTNQIQIVGDVEIDPGHGVPSVSTDAAFTSSLTLALNTNDVSSGHGHLSFTVGGLDFTLSLAGWQNSSSNGGIHLGKVTFLRPYSLRDGGHTGSGAGPFVLVSNSYGVLEGTGSTGGGSITADVHYFISAQPSYNGSNQLNGFDLYINFGWVPFVNGTGVDVPTSLSINMANMTDLYWSVV